MYVSRLARCVSVLLAIVGPVTLGFTLPINYENTFLRRREPMDEPSIPGLPQVRVVRVVSASSTQGEPGTGAERHVRRSLDRHDPEV